jgi:choline dehydrogenase-like flavoprotein
MPIDAMILHNDSEQLPNPTSRVSLGSKRDALGLQEVVLDWRLTAEDKRHVNATHRLLGSEIGRAAFGRLRYMLDEDDTTWPEDLRGAEHHMGTTRMHRDSAKGVVDENCRVHGLANLYVAGSSVFPTGGVANPTLTIVTLALRLADHIKEELA